MNLYEIFKKTFLIILVLIGFGSVQAVPITGCGTFDTAGETYVLQNDIIVGGGCFVIVESNITLDGAGYKITNDDYNQYGVFVYDDGIFIDGVVVYSVLEGITIKNLVIDGFASGIYVRYSTGVTVYNNTITSGRYYGIHFKEVNDSYIYNNVLTAIDGYGLRFLSSNGNKIYNNILDNDDNFIFTDSINTFNIDVTSGTNIIGGPYLGGNYWANPSGTGFSQICTVSYYNGLCGSINILDIDDSDYFPLIYGVSRSSSSRSNKSGSSFSGFFSTGGGSSVLKVFGNASIIIVILGIFFGYLWLKRPPEGEDSSFKRNNKKGGD